jgi:hypothetical protein
LDPERAKAHLSEGQKGKKQAQKEKKKQAQKKQTR